MRLVYKDTGKEVKVGDVCVLSCGTAYVVDYFRKPHKPASSGKVSMRHGGSPWTEEFYVGVIGAEWVEREDRGE